MHELGRRPCPCPGLTKRTSGTNTTVTDNWISGSGDWSIGADWSTGSPPNDAVTGDATDATITLASPGIVTLASGETYASQNVTLGSAGTTLQIAGELDLTGLLSPGLGTLDIYGGTLSGGAILPGSNLILTEYNVSHGPETEPVLNNVAILGNVTLSGVIFTGSTAVYADAMGTTPGTLTIGNFVTIESAATTYSLPENVIVSGSLNVSGIPVSGSPTPAAPTLIIPAGITVTAQGGAVSDGGSAITNQGTIDLGASGISVYAASFSNQAIIRSEGGQLSLTEPFDNTAAASVALTNEAGLATNYTFAPSTFGIGPVVAPAVTNEGAISADTGMLNFSSSVTNSGQIIATGAGTINITPATSYIGYSVPTSTTANSGTMSVGAGGHITLGEGVTNSGTIAVGNGGTLTLGTGGAVALNNTGTISLTGGTLVLRNDANAATLSSFTLLSGTKTNPDASTSPVGDTLDIDGGTFDNSGASLGAGIGFSVITVTGGTVKGGTLDPALVTGGVAGGTLDDVAVIGPLTTTGPVTFTGGTQIYADASRSAAGALTVGDGINSAFLFIQNPGPLTVTSSVTLNNGGLYAGQPGAANSLTIAAGGSVSGNGAFSGYLFTGGSFALTNNGTLASTGLNPGAFSNELTVSATSFVNNASVTANTASGAGAPVLYITASAITNNATISTDAGDLYLQAADTDPDGFVNAAGAEITGGQRQHRLAGGSVHQ